MLVYRFFFLSLRDSRGGLPRAPHRSGSPNQDGIELASAHLAVLLLNPGKRPQHQPTVWLLGPAAGICGCSFWIIQDLLAKEPCVSLSPAGDCSAGRLMDREVHHSLERSMSSQSGTVKGLLYSPSSHPRRALRSNNSWGEDSPGLLAGLNIFSLPLNPPLEVERRIDDRR